MKREALVGIELRLDGTDDELLCGILDLPTERATAVARASPGAHTVGNAGQEGEHEPRQDASEQEQRRDRDPSELGVGMTSSMRR